MPPPPTPTDEPAATGTGSATAGDPVDDLSYEQARDELVRVVARLEAGGETLEDSLQLWERGEALAARCQQWLDGARRRLQTVHDAATPASPGTRGAGASGAPPGTAADGHDDEDAR